MKTLLVGLVAIVPVLVWGAPSAQEVKPESAFEEKSEVKTIKKKSREVNFDDLLVQGKYSFSDEAVTTVEQDKVLDSLLGVRKDFKDRIRKSVSQQ